MDEGTRDLRGERAPSTLPYEEEFLFHLSRGSEMLVDNRVEAAKEELERALAVQPHDAKGQDLLASVYFRLGLYPRAIELWSHLVRQHPDDVALRVNLGLVLLKTGQPEDARANFAHAALVEPKHARAYRYLGLAEWRCGNLDRAREAFLRGGEVTMANRMAEMLGERDERTSDSPSTSGEVRALAATALEQFIEPETMLAVEPARASAATTGAWQVVEHVADRARVHDRAHEHVRAEPTSGAETARQEGRPVVLPLGAPVLDDVAALTQQLARWTVPSDETTALAVAPNGLMAVDTRASVAMRVGRVRARRGALTHAPLARRSRRATDDGLLGGEADPIVLCEGPVHALVAPPPANRFVALALEDETLFLVERFVEAFDAGLESESARVTGLDPVLSLRGRGTVVLRVPEEPCAMTVRAGETVYVAPGALVGWTGRLFPVDEPTSAADLALRGDGMVLVATGA
jgi:Flp pilus assembly protein TadD